MSKTILLLDDDPDFRGLIVPELLKRGHAVIEAGSGREASLVIDRHTVDLIIADGRLPDTNGVDWIADLRKRGIRTETIFVSAFWRDAESFRRLTRELGVSLVIHKPVIPSVFAEQVAYLAARPEPGPKKEKAKAPIAQVMQLLRGEYAASLSGKIKELAHAVHQVMAHPDDTYLRGEAQSQAHRLRGTAGSYGFVAVGEGASTIEDLLIDLELCTPEEKARRIAALEPALEIAIAAVVKACSQSGIPPQEMALGRILVVDADQDWLAQVQRQGERQLIEVATADSGDAAVETARTLSPEAFMIGVEVESGEEMSKLVRTLRALPGCEAAPLALCASRPDMEARVAAIHLGASLLLDKPMPSTLLSSVLTQLIDQRQAVKPRVLVVDDDTEFTSRTAALLRHADLWVHVVSDAHDILEVLHEVRPDILLLDVILPGLSGYDVCRMLRTSPRWRDLPILILTVLNGVESRVAAFRAGADDYLAKPTVDEELLARVQSRLERARLLRERAEVDSLTGLLLRRTFLESLTAQLSEVQRRKSTLTLVLIDLDHFKEVNDDHGHLIGDRLLAGFGRLLLHSLRPDDLRGRWGGDEFVLAFAGETPETIRGVISRLRSDLESWSIEGSTSEPVHLSFSAGIACFPTDGTSPRALLEAADRHMYDEKRSRKREVEAERTRPRVAAEGSAGRGRAREGRRK